MDSVCNKSEKHTPESMEKAVFHCTSIDDFKGLVSLYRLSLRSSELLKAFYGAFDEAAYFLEDAAEPRIAGMAKVRLRKQRGGKLKRKLMKERGSDLNGVTLRHPTFDVYAILLPDASQPGRYRASLFDVRGFSNHITRDSYETVLDEVLEDGFIEESPGALERLFNNPEWRNWYEGRGQKL